MSPVSTTNLGLLEPVGSDAPSELRIAIATNATTIDPYSFLTATVSNTGSASVTRGQSVIASPSTTQTLPSASAGALVAITALSTVTGATPVTVSGSKIYGVGLSNASTFLLGTPGAHAVLQSDGTNWYVVGGQQDTGWVALSLSTGMTATGGSNFTSAYTPSARLIGSRVWLKGAIQQGSTGNSGSSIATVPLASMYPASQAGINATQQNTTQETIAATALRVNTSGVLASSSGTSGTGANGMTWSLDDLSYPIS